MTKRNDLSLAMPRPWEDLDVAIAALIAQNGDTATIARLSHMRAVTYKTYVADAVRTHVSKRTLLQRKVVEDETGAL